MMFRTSGCIAVLAGSILASGSILTSGLIARAQMAQPLVNSTAGNTGGDVDGVLDQLQQRGQHLQAFVADVTLTETDMVMGSDTVRSGKVWYQLPASGQARLHILFTTKALNDHPAAADRREYLLDGPWLTDRDYTTRIETRRQIAKPGEKVNLFQLGKGPFPLPIGQDKADVHRLFDVALIPAAPDDPANTDHLKLTPKPGTDFARKINVLNVWVDRSSSMPVRIDTVDAPQTTERTTELKNLQINPSPDVSDHEFSLPPLAPGWNSHEEPLAP